MYSGLIGAVYANLLRQAGHGGFTVPFAKDTDSRPAAAWSHLPKDEKEPWRHWSPTHAAAFDPEQPVMSHRFRVSDGVAQFVRVKVSGTRTRSRSSPPSLKRV